MIDTNSLIDQQKEICAKYLAKFEPAHFNDRLGISDNTNGVLTPINGLRHPPKADMTGWYIWSGERFSYDKDYFKGVHVFHMIERCPQILKYLALPPGYRFLIDNKGYEDVWFDKSLLDIES